MNQNNTKSDIWFKGRELNEPIIQELHYLVHTIDLDTKNGFITNPLIIYTLKLNIKSYLCTIFT